MHHAAISTLCTSRREMNIYGLSDFVFTSANWPPAQELRHAFMMRWLDAQAYFMDTV